MAVFLGAVDRESLFLALALAAFLLAERGHRPRGPTAAGAATLTRSVGVAVIAGLVVMAWPDIRTPGLLAIAPVMFAAFPIALHLQVHDAWTFVHEKNSLGPARLPGGPTGGLWSPFAPCGARTNNFTQHFYLAVNIEGARFSGFFVALIPIGLEDMWACPTRCPQRSCFLISMSVPANSRSTSRSSRCHG